MSTFAQASFRTLSLAVVAASLVACDATPTAADAGPPTAPPTATGVLRLAHNDWLSASLNDQVAKILLEEQLGYTVQFVAESSSDQFTAVAGGDAVASLEVWPGGHRDAIAQYIERDRTIVNVGVLGPTARVGWFIPTYMLAEHPELVTWQGFQKPENAALFATPETGTLGRFVGGSKTWIEYDDQIIANLNLSFKVIYAGSEDAELKLLDEAYATRSPFLFYFWLPHWAHEKYDLTLVKLPEYSADCFAKAAAGGVDCSYPADVLFKMVWHGLEASEPKAFAFFSKFTLSATDQIAMMADVSLRGRTVDEAARGWIAAHGATWRAWIVGP